jgi:hypothetical protein
MVAGGWGSNSSASVAERTSLTVTPGASSRFPGTSQLARSPEADTFPVPLLATHNTCAGPQRTTAGSPSTPWSANKAVVQSLSVLVSTQSRSQHDSSTNNRPPTRPRMPLATLRPAPPQRVLAGMSACLRPRELCRREVLAILSAAPGGPGRSAQPTGPSRPVGHRRRVRALCCQLAGVHHTRKVGPSSVVEALDQPKLTGTNMDAGYDAPGAPISVPRCKKGRLSI